MGEVLRFVRVEAAMTKGFKCRISKWGDKRRDILFGDDVDRCARRGYKL